MIDWKELSKKLRQAVPALTVFEEEPLSRHTSFRIGGPAALFVKPADEDQLAQVLRFAASHDITPRMLGAGTNVLAPDEGLRALVVCTKDALLGLSDLGDGVIEAYAGETLSKTAVFAKNLGLMGLEFAHGIPGTVGGGIYMNAGAYGGEMKQVSVQTTVLTMDGEEKTVSGEAQGFAYRTSAFEKMDAIIVKTRLQLAPGDKTEISAKMQELIEKRRASQPLEFPSAGSTFKRPEGAFAGALIQEAGLKGTRVGGAQVSEKHAGFVVNTADATADDVKKLIALVQKRVFEMSGFTLQPEVRIW
mgnify:CR=1 FL=1